MPKVVGVRFNTSPRVYFFSPAEGEEYKKDDNVIVETQRGVEIGRVIQPIHDVDEDKIVSPLKPITRIATEEDMQAVYMDGEKKLEILRTAREKVAARNLEMKVVDCEYTADRGKLVLYFTAEQRVDFRELVRDLASAFRMRIDLRQIGARDECKMIGSLAPCGMPCCCGRFESDSEHVSIKMAKNQNLALTPGKINGMCGRLLCCLSYENKTYEDIMRRMPKHGAAVIANDGRRGTVVSVTPLSEKVRVRFGDDDNFEFCELPLSELTVLRNKADNEKSENAAPPAERSVSNDRTDKKERDRGEKDINKSNKSGKQQKKRRGDDKTPGVDGNADGRSDNHDNANAAKSNGNQNNGNGNKHRSRRGKRNGKAKNNDMRDKAAREQNNGGATDGN